MVDHVFPEDEGTGAANGDWNDAANFSQLADAVGHNDFVVRGLNIQNVDYSLLTFGVSQGVAVVSQASATANNTNESRDGATFVAEADARTGLALTDAATNHVYLDVDLTTDDTISIVVNTTGTKPAEPSLKLGEVDTSANTVTEVNRRRKLGKAEAQLVEFPDGSATSPTVTFSNDTDTGIYRAAGNTLAVATGGTTAVEFESNQNLTLPNGNLSFSSSTYTTISNVNDISSEAGRNIHVGVHGVGDSILLYDFNNNQSILTAREGGDIDAPNGNFSLGDDNDVVLGTNDDYGFHFDSTNSRLELVANPNGTPTDILRVNGTGIYSPNRDLYMEDNHIRRVESLRFSGDNNFDSLFTTGAPLRIRSMSSSTTMAWFHENGDIEFPSGPVTQGNDPSTIITETTSPKSWNFSGSRDIDIHRSTDVTISNGTTTSATEDITVELYDGSGTTGTLLLSETKGVSVGANGTSTVNFIATDEPLNTGTYHIEITQSGTTLSVDQTDENTRGATFSLQQTTTGTGSITSQYGNDLIRLDPVTDEVEIPNARPSLIDDTPLRIGTNDNFDIVYDSATSQLKFISDPAGPDTQERLVIPFSTGGVTGINFKNNNVVGVNNLQINDTGGGEGIQWRNQNGGMDIADLDGTNGSTAYTRIRGNDVGVALMGNTVVPNGSIQQGRDPQDTITETTSPKSFNFSGNRDRDIHNRTDVTISNGTTASATENITVELYDGIDTTGTLMQSETQSVTVSANGSSTVSFITNDEYLNLGDYHIEVTQSGTTLSVDQTDEFTRGATYTLEQTDMGIGQFEDQYNRSILTFNPVYNTVKVENGPLIAYKGIELFSGSTGNERFGLKYINGTDDLMLTNREAGGALHLYGNDGTSGGEAAALTIPSATNPDLWVQNDLMNASGSQTIWDSASQYVPAGSQEAGETVVASGTATLSGGTAVVSTGVTTTGNNFDVRLDPSGGGVNTADVKAAARVYWDNTNGVYKIEILEDGTSVGNPDVGYEVTMSA